MNPQGISTGAEQDNGVDKTQDTIALNEKAEKIAEKIGTDEAKQQLNELKQVTISKLHDLQLETSTNLHYLQGEIDYSVGTVSEEEFEDVENAYVDVEELLADIPTPNIPSELEGISDTDFSELSTNNAQRVLDFLTDGYLVYPESSWGPASFTNTLSEANSQEDIRVAQQILIDKIHGDGTFERGYTDDGMVLGYSGVEGGNFLRTQTEFEEQLKSGDIFNPKMFSNYAKFLTDNGKIEELPELMGDRMKTISVFITTSDDSDIQTVRRRLVDAKILEGNGGPGEFMRKKAIGTLASIMNGINERTVEKGDEGVDQLIQRLQNMSQFTLLGFGIENIIGSELYGNIQEKFTELGSSGANIHTRLFQLSSTIHNIGEGFYGNPLFSFLEGNPIEVAHNETTEKIITRMIKEEDGYLAVGFDSQKGYYVRTEEEFKSSLAQVGGDVTKMNKTEVGTFLCSLHQKTTSPEEMLTKIEDIFGVENTIRLLSTYKDGDFGGQNFNGSNWRVFYKDLLDGFETKMIKVAEAYFKQETDGGRMLDTIEASNGYSELDSVNIDPTHLHSVTREEDVRDLNHEGVKRTILSKRDTEFVNEALTAQENMLTRLTTIYGDSPAIMDFFRSTLSINGVSEEFDINVIQQLIQVYNTENPDTPVPNIQGEEFSSLLESISLLKEVNLAVKFNESISTIIYLQVQMEEIQTSLNASQEELSRLRTEGTQEEIDRVKLDSFRLQHLSYGAGQAQARALQSVSDLNEEAGEQVALAVAAGDMDGLQDVQDEYGISDSDMKQLLGRMVSDINFGNADALYNQNFDFSDENISKAFLENRDHIYLLQNEDDLISLLNIEGNGITMSEINPSLRGSLNVIRALPELKSSDIYLIPEEYFRLDSNLNTNYGRVAVLLKKTTWSQRTIISMFQSNNDTSGCRIFTEIVFGILQDDLLGLSTLQKLRIKSSLRRSNEILIHFSDEQKSDLGLNREIVRDETSDKNRFEAIINKMRLPGYDNTSDDGPNVEDIPFIIEYLEEYGIHDVKDQFRWLIKSKGPIQTHTLEPILSAMSWSESNRDLILEGIQSRGNEVVKCLKSEFKSNPTIIEESLKGLGKRERKEILNYLKIVNTKGVIAVYRGTDNSLEDTVELLWNKFNAQELNQISQTLPDGKYNNATIFQEVINGISSKYNNEIAAESDFIQVKEIIKDDNSRLNLAGDYLRREFSDEKYQGQVESILESIANDPLADETMIKISNLLGDAGIESPEEIKDFYRGLYLSVSDQSALDSSKAGEKDFEQSEIGNLPINLLQTGEYGKYEIGGDIIYDSRNKSNNALVEDFKSHEFSGEYAAQINEYLSIHGINPDSEFGQAVTTVLTSEKIRIEAYVASKEPNVSRAADNTIRYNSGETNAFDGYADGVRETITDGTTDLSEMESAEDIGKRHGVTINSNGSFSPLGDDEKIEDSSKTNQNQSESFNTGDQWLNKSAEGRSLITYNGETQLVVDNNTSISITQSDLLAIEDNPEAEANLIKLYSEFQETGLERIWEHKDAIFKSLGNNGGFKFNSQDGGYVDTTEANVLFSTILYTTTENPKYRETGLSLEETKAAIVRETHGAAGETNVEATGKQGNKLEKSFVNKFTMRNQGDEGRFNYTAFNKALKGDFSPNPQ